MYEIMILSYKDNIFLPNNAIVKKTQKKPGNNVSLGWPYFYK